MVGGGLPVAEQVKATSTLFSLASALTCTAVVTSDIPGGTKKASHKLLHWVHWFKRTKAACFAVWPLGRGSFCFVNPIRRSDWI